MQQPIFLTFALLSLWATLNEAASVHRKLQQPRASELRPRHRRSRPHVVEWGCPDLNCPAVNADCQLMEVIAFRYAGGECLGCPYCIDLPAIFYTHSPRHRRNVIAAADLSGAEAGSMRTRRTARRDGYLSPIAQHEICRRVTCPVSPPDGNCHHPGILDGFLRETKCISCPACLDSNKQ